MYKLLEYMSHKHIACNKFDIANLSSLATRIKRDSYLLRRFSRTPCANRHTLKTRAFSATKVKIKSNSKTCCSLSGVSGAGVRGVPGALRAADCSLLTG
jgi:hypothetical protein